MKPIILNVNSLPSQIREKFNVKKVSVKEDKENIKASSKNPLATSDKK